MLKKRNSQIKKVIVPEKNPELRGRERERERERERDLNAYRKADGYEIVKAICCYSCLRDFRVGDGFD
jgi:hypothetical protein